MLVGTLRTGREPNRGRGCCLFTLPVIAYLELLYFWRYLRVPDCSGLGGPICRKPAIANSVSPLKPLHLPDIRSEVIRSSAVEPENPVLAGGDSSQFVRNGPQAPAHACARPNAGLDLCRPAALTSGGQKAEATRATIRLEQERGARLAELGNSTGACRARNARSTSRTSGFCTRT